MTLIRKLSALVVTFVVIAAVCGSKSSLWAQTGNEIEEVESFVADLYSLVSFTPNNLPDWDKVKERFHERAIIVLYAGQETYNVHTLDSFVEDFRNFIRDFAIESIGFNENVVASNTKIIGNMAYSLVLYEAHIPGSQRPPQQGIDSIQMIKTDDIWRIVSITNEVIRPGVPVPDEHIRK